MISFSLVCGLLPPLSLSLSSLHVSLSLSPCPPSLPLCLPLPHDRCSETDQVLVDDAAFRQFVELYAQDQEVFFRDYAEAHRKLSELGSYFLPSADGVEVLEF
jgi:hypothetical protein